MTGPATSFELKEPPSPEALVPDHGLWPWFAGAAALLLLVALAVWWFSRKRKAVCDPLTLRNAAFNEALAAFSAARLESARLAAVQSSLIVRKYLSAAAGDPSLFETHEEFVARRDSLLALTATARTAAETGFARLATLKYAPEIPDVDPAAIIGESRTLLETLHRGFAA